MEVFPLYLDSFGNLVQAQSSDTLGIPATGEVLEYATLLQNTPIYTCCSLITATAVKVTSLGSSDPTFRPKPYVDCITLEYGNAGNRVRVAKINGLNYTINDLVDYDNSSELYLSRYGKITTVRPSLGNGDKWLVVIGRLINQNEFIFAPQEPIDLNITPDKLQMRRYRLRRGL